MIWVTAFLDSASTSKSTAVSPDPTSKIESSGFKPSNGSPTHGLPKYDPLVRLGGNGDRISRGRVARRDNDHIGLEPTALAGDQRITPRRLLGNIDNFAVNDGQPGPGAACGVAQQVIKIISVNFSGNERSGFNRRVALASHATKWSGSSGRALIRRAGTLSKCSGLAVAYTTPRAGLRSRSNTSTRGEPGPCRARWTATMVPLKPHPTIATVGSPAALSALMSMSCSPLDRSTESAAMLGEPGSERSHDSPRQRNLPVCLVSEPASVYSKVSRSHQGR